MKLIKSNAVGAVALVLIQTACSGSGGGGGGSELATPLTFSGTVTVTPASLNPISPNKKNPHVLLTESPLQYAHVNVCRLTSDNKLEKIPGTSTVIAGTDGTFSLSIAAIHVPSNHIIVVCVSKPNGDWELFSVIPQDLLQWILMKSRQLQLM